VQYFRNGLVATQRSDLITVYTWLSPAIRLAQLLGLHRLGNDPSRMPADDPAFPPGVCKGSPRAPSTADRLPQRSAIKRETAKRIWSYLLTSDWLTCTHNGYAQIPPDTCTSFRLPRQRSLTWTQSTPTGLCSCVSSRSYAAWADNLQLLDEDMTPDTEFAEERPASHLTDTTFVRVRTPLIAIQRV
jgi:hypothetical protein